MNDWIEAEVDVLERQWADELLRPYATNAPRSTSGARPRPTNAPRSTSAPKPAVQHRPNSMYDDAIARFAKPNGELTDVYGRPLARERRLPTFEDCETEETVALDGSTVRRYYRTETIESGELRRRLVHRETILPPGAHGIPRPDRTA